jgi:hypothetical protein
MRFFDNGVNVLQAAGPDGPCLSCYPPCQRGMTAQLPSEDTE